MLGGPGGSRSWGTPHAWGSLAPLGTSWSPEAGAVVGEQPDTRDVALLWESLVAGESCRSGA